MFGYFRTSFNCKFSYICVGKCKAFYITDICVQHHLIDMAGGNHLFIDDCTDIPALCHTDIVDILYLCYCFVNTHTFGCQAS